MRRFPRAFAALLAALLVISPAASAAEPMLPTILDQKIGEVDEDIERANSTYGERSEFQRAQSSLARSSLALLNDAWIVSHDELIKASGGLETGKARAQASGSGSEQRVVDHGRQLASEARSTLSQVRDSLSSMERTGLEPVAFSGGLTAAYAANRAMDLLREHDAAVNQWEQGRHNDQIEAAIVSTGAGAQIAASVASDVLSETAEARANATGTQLLSAEQLDELVNDRAGWTEANHAPVAKRSYERVMTMAEEDERLMALSAYTIYFQDVAFNGIRQEQQRGNDIDAFAEAQNMYEENITRAEGWVETLDTPGDLPLGAMASANFSLELNENATGESRQRSGAFALGLAHLGIEQAGLLQQAYGAERHDPGTRLAEVQLASQEDEGLLATVPATGALLAAALMAFVALARRGRR